MEGEGMEEERAKEGTGGERRSVRMNIGKKVHGKNGHGKKVHGKKVHGKLVH